jgi:serine/threonine-protein kinase
MAPEQIDRNLGPIGPHTDVYGLGALLRMLCGGRGIANCESLGEMRERLAPLGDEPLIDELPGDMPAAVRRICHRCLDCDWRRRYPTAAEVARELRTM